MAAPLSEDVVRGRFAEGRNAEAALVFVERSKERLAYNPAALLIETR